MDNKWMVHNDLHGSNHFPMILKSPQPVYADKLACWKINKSNWEEFKTLFNQKLMQNPNNKNLTKHFTETLILIAKETIPKTSPSNGHNTP